MWAPQPPSLHRIAAVSTAFRNSTTAFMSTRPPFRGGRSFHGRRNYSDRPNFVAGDANFGFHPPATTANNNDFNNLYNAQNYSYENHQNNRNDFRSGNNNMSDNRYNAQSYSYDSPRINPNDFRSGGYHNINSNQYNAQNYSYVNQRNYQNDFPGGGNNNISNNQYTAQNYSYENHQSNRNDFRGGGNNNPSSRGGVYFGPRPALPSYNQPAAGVHRSKPPDFRTWEFAKNPPPSNSERFVVLSYNILADYLADGHRMMYSHIPRRFMSWEWRKSNVLFELKLWSPDVMCLQEVDKFQELEEDLRLRGYSGFWKMRTGEPVDGCAIFFRTTRFKLMFEDYIEFNKHGMRDNVTQICVLESLTQGDKQLSSSSSGGPNRVVVCNIHVLYNPRRGEMKLGQVRLLLEKAQAVSKTWDDAPIVLCGDFNCTPKSPMYNFILQQKLDISQVKRDQVSGQSSAEIRPPARSYSNYFRRELAGNMANLIISPDIVLESKTKGSDDLNKSQPVNSCSSSPESAEVSVIGPTTDLPSQPLDDLGPISDLPSQPAEDLNSPSDLSHDKTDEKVIGLSQNEMNKSSEDNADLGDDTEESLPTLHSGQDASPRNLDEVALESHIAVENKPYDPSMWTAMEIATATGSSDITTLEHPLKLRSTYSEVADSRGTRDSCGEPLVTSYNSRFMGTVDYIWRSEGLQTIKVLAPIPKDVMLPSGGFPTKKWGSDHIALATELAFTK